MRKNSRADEAVRNELKKMAKTPEYAGAREQFSDVSGGLVARHGDSEDTAWKAITDNIIGFLPAYLTDGFIQCSRETVKESDEYKKAAGKKYSRLVIKPGKKFPALAFPAFYPYLEFILRWGSYDVLKWKKSFKVEGAVQLRDVSVTLDNEKVTGISGTVIVTFVLSVCKGPVPWKLWEAREVLLHLEG